MLPADDATWTLPTPLGPTLRLEAGPRGLSEARLVPEAGEARPEPPAPVRDPIASYLDDPASGLPDLPLDLSVGTAFQRAVWQELRGIPVGEVRTYGEVAAEAGTPGAARAAGNAVAANPLVLLVPCHRVVPASGGVGGYSAAGGPALKRELLRAEGAPAEARPR